MGSFGRSKDDSKALEAMRRNTRLGIAAVAAFALGYVAYATGGRADEPLRGHGAELLDVDEAAARRRAPELRDDVGAVLVVVRAAVGPKRKRIVIVARALW